MKPQVVAIGVASLAAVTLGTAIATRSSPTPAPEICIAPTEPPLSTAAASTADPPPRPVGPPKIDAVRAKSSPAQLGVDVQLEVALTLAAASFRESVSIQASCELEGEWYSGYGSIYLDKLMPGANVVKTKLSVARQHAFTIAPTQCQLAFEYTWRTPYKRETLARMCWNGTEVTDVPCIVKSRDDVSVSAVRVATPLDRYGTLRLGTPVDLEVSLDAELARPLDDWQIQVAATCTLADGTKHQAKDRVYLRDVHTGRPFTGKTWLFRRGAMTDLPQSCTVAVELADRHDVVRAPVSAWCWRDGVVVPGACAV